MPQSVKLHRTRPAKEQSNLARLPGVTTGARLYMLLRLCLIALGQAGIAAGLALAIADVIGALLRSEAPDLWLSGLAAGAIPLMALLRWLERVQAEQLGQDYVFAMRRRLVKCLLDTPATALVRHTDGPMLLRFSGDMSALRNWAARGLARIIVGASTLFAGIVALVWLDARVGLAFGLAAVVFMVIGWLLTHPLTKTEADARRSRGRLGRRFAETLTTIGAYQAAGAVRRAARRLASSGQDVRRAAMAQARAAGALQALSDSAAAVLPLICVIMAATFNAEPASAVAGMAIAGLLAPRLRDLGRSAEYWTRGRIARQRIASAIDRLPQQRRRLGRKKSPSQAAIRFEKLTIPPRLQSLYGEAYSGERIALTGDNGAGKSLFLTALAGLTPCRGRIWVYGQAAHGVRPGTLAALISYVGDAAPIIAGSVDSNLRLAAPDISQAAIDAVIQQFDLNAIRLRTERVTALGRNLSSGERMRLLTARALLSSPKILLLDEFEANLDAASKNKIDAALEQFEGLIIFASHDMARVAKADRVWSIESGRLCESATMADVRPNLEIV